MSALPRSARTSAAARLPRAGQPRAALPNGWWGTAVFIATEATLFGTLIGTYYFLRFNSLHWPPPGISAPKPTLPLVLTGLLVATSAPVQFAVSAAGRGRLSAARVSLLVALVVQAGYLAMQLHLFSHDAHEFPPSGSSYASIYFTLLGAHHLHVLIGLLLSGWVLLRTATGLTPYRMTGLRVTAFYWHFINVLALVVVGTQLSASV
ncbi:MAG TPA: heme-copper oxidase subunit III [Gaiellaceae bacterium]